MRWRLTLEYDGAAFCGWRANDTLRGVEGVLAQALFDCTQERPTITAAGRTDTGVHALGQVVHFDLKAERSSKNMRDGLNFYLKDSRLSVIEAKSVEPTFHARFDAIQRVYRYRLFTRLAPSPLEIGRSWHIYQIAGKFIDLQALKDAGKVFEGTHDFAGFRGADCESARTVRSIDKISIISDQDIIAIEIASKAFLYRQIRRMVGAMVAGSTAKVKLSSIEKRLADPTFPLEAHSSAPAHGLYFVEVKYPN